MTLNELLERLQDLLDEGIDGDTPIRGAIQPNYPLIAEIGAITTYVGSSDQAGVYIALNEPREYGRDTLWADEIFNECDGCDDEDCDDCGAAA